MDLGQKTPFCFFILKILHVCYVILSQNNIELLHLETPKKDPSERRDGYKNSRFLFWIYFYLKGRGLFPKMRLTCDKYGALCKLIGIGQVLAFCFVCKKCCSHLRNNKKRTTTQGSESSKSI